MKQKTSKHTYEQFKEKISNVTQLLVSNQKFTGKNQVTRRFCCRPRYFQHLPHQRRVVE